MVKYVKKRFNFIKKRYDDIFIIVNANIPYEISSEIIYELKNKLII